VSPIPGVGAQHVRAAAGTDPRGILTFESLPDDLQRAEDSTQAADRERRYFSGDPAVIWGTDDPVERQRLQRAADRVIRDAGIDVYSAQARPATPAERLLLGHLGYELPTELFTIITWPSGAIRRRRWPQIETLLESMS
jgi:hypothetical protein